MVRVLWLSMLAEVRSIWVHTTCQARPHHLRKSLLLSVSHSKVCSHSDSFADKHTGRLQGSVFVTRRARVFLGGTFKHTPSLNATILTKIFQRNLPRQSTVHRKSWTPWRAALTRRQSSGLETLMSRLISSSAVFEIGIQMLEYVLVNWSSPGKLIEPPNGSCTYRFNLRAEVAALFEPSAQSIIEAIETQRKNSSKPVAVCHLISTYFTVV